MTKIDIFSGFLGAGKTTLIKKLIKEAYSGEKLVLIENEFGDIGIDGGFMQEAGIIVDEINSGCICCSLVGDFGQALKKVMEEYSPDRIIIEPSGVGKLSDVIAAVENAELENAVINATATVVDASKCRIYMKNFGEFFNNQVESTGCIIFSHTSKLTEEKLGKALELVKEKNPLATIITTDWQLLDGSSILEAVEHTNTLVNYLKEVQAEFDHHHHEHHHDHGEECSCGCHGHHEHKDHCGHNDESAHHHEHHHDHGEECSCGCHGHHEHKDHCEHNDHEHECHCEHHHDHHDHHHDHGEECSCGCHGHHEHKDHCEHNDESAHHHEHHHDHGEECSCGCHGHHEHKDHCEHNDHEHECPCEHHHDHHDHHHDHGEECSCGCHGHHEHKDHREHNDHEHECHCEHHHDHHDHHHDHGEECSCGCHGHDHHHHHADEVFSNWGVESAKKFTEEKLANILEEIQDEGKYGMILRAKGIVPDSENREWLHFDYVPGEYDIRHGSAAVTGRLCVIGSSLNEEALKELFEV